MAARSKPGMRSNAEAARLVVSVMEKAGSLEAVDGALKVAVLQLAAAVDAKPGDAGLWREYRTLLQTLKEVAAGGSDDDTAAFLVTVRAPVGDKAKP